MLVEQNVDLTPFNTLNVKSIAEFYCQVHDLDQLKSVVGFARTRKLSMHILGGGSNVILASYLPGVVVHMAMLGREINPINDTIADFTVSAGEIWHDLVTFSLDKGYSGLENLSLIPGTVGAAPVQNIGAYGVEIKDMLTEVMAIDLTSDSLTPIRLKKASLDFEYRNSLFKKNPGRYIITSVTLRLDKQSPLKIGYGDIATQLNKGNICAQDVSNAVIAARQAKLPDVSKIPNAGSFFKNPVIDADKLDELQARFSGLISYELNDNTYKLAAGWLIQEAGWKGYCNDKVGVHDKQALVLVNHAGGEAKDILELAGRIKDSVEEIFGVLLEVEPVIM